MEFLDPKKQRAHTIRLFIGYILIGTALLLTTIILLYQAYGFGIKNGEVIQNGLVFVSSTPNPADIYVNGQQRKEQTNVRLLMPAGQYTFDLKRSGYRDWKRAISVEGGTVVRFDYPLLFPTNLTTTTTKQYTVQPTIATQSPDHRWLLVQSQPAYNAFDLFDLEKPDEGPTTVTLPPAISTLSGTHSWKLVEWASDNIHVLLQHTAEADGQQTSEYILLNHEKPDESVNVTATLNTGSALLSLRDKKYDKYFVHDQAVQTLQTASLQDPKPVSFLTQVLSFKSHGASTVLYATDQGVPSGRTAIKIRDGDKTYGIRQVQASAIYLLDLAKYSGDWYVVAGSPAENKTYVYKNPVSAQTRKPDLPLVPVQVLKTAQANYVKFSDNARFIMAENAQQFSVYDAENEKGFTYTVQAPLDAPQLHAEWMDGHRLSYVSGGKLLVFDYDHTNQEALVTADPAYTQFHDKDYKVLYALTTQTTKDAAGKDVTQFVLTSTALRTPADQ